MLPGALGELVQRFKMATFLKAQAGQRLCPQAAFKPPNQTTSRCRFECRRFGRMHDALCRQMSAAGCLQG